LKTKHNAAFLIQEGRWRMVPKARLGGELPVLYKTQHIIDGRMKKNETLDKT
jgi:hypothetical protein